MQELMSMVWGNTNGMTRRKRGFGIVEVLVAAAVLGFLYIALLNLQGGNHESLLRIRGRDGATEVAQNIIDSLGALGLASLSDDKLAVGADGTVDYKIVLPPITRSWEAQPGTVSNTITVEYNVEVTVSPDAEYTASAGSLLDTAKHVYAKRLDVKVSWMFKNTKQSITVSGVVR